MAQLEEGAFLQDRWTDRRKKLLALGTGCFQSEICEQEVLPINSCLTPQERLSLSFSSFGMRECVVGKEAGVLPVCLLFWDSGWGGERAEELWQERVQQDYLVHRNGRASK